MAMRIGLKDSMFDVRQIADNLTFLPEGLGLRMLLRRGLKMLLGSLVALTELVCLTF